MAVPSENQPFALLGAALRVRDVETVAAFYEAALGLDRLSTSADGISLGTEGAELLRLEAAPDAPARPSGSAGLFHLAFLLETRADLARVVNRLRSAGISLSGASDHGVSEALYLDDPEGNGVEIYADAPEPDWPRDSKGALAMVTRALDGAALMSAVSRDDRAAPQRVRLGHVHLEVGDVGKAAAFYAEALPLAPMQRLPSAAFMGADGYHHHVGLNAWRAAGAGPAAADALGLAEIWYRGGDAERFGDLSDPWGAHWRRIEASAHAA